MAKIWCAEITCEHNKNNQCRAKEINLSAGVMHTVYEGARQVWTCRTFEMAEDLKELAQILEKELSHGQPF